MTANDYVVRARTLPARLQRARPTLTVWDVTETHTRRAVHHGVHVCPDLAAAHAARLNHQAAADTLRAAQADARARAADRARILARHTRETTEGR